MSTQSNRTHFRPAPEDIRPLTEAEQQQNRDHDWVLRDAYRLRQYAGQVVAVYRERIWGHGGDHVAAANDADTALRAAATTETLSVDDLTFVFVPESFADDLPASGS